jgi:hypothetical protein
MLFLILLSDAIGVRVSDRSVGPAGTFIGASPFGYADNRFALLSFFGMDFATFPFHFLNEKI